MEIEANLKLVGNPCKNKPTNAIVDQDTIRLSKAEVADQKTSSKNIETTSSTLILEGQQDKDNGASCDKTGLILSKTGLTSLSGVSKNKSEPKMVKPKKPEIGVWKTVESKGHYKHEKEKPKPIHRELPAKSKRQMNVNDASRLENYNFTSMQNLLRDSDSMTMPFPSHGSHMPMSCGPYCSMLYSCPSWYYNLCMPSLPRYCMPTINKSSPTNNDCFHQKDRCVHKIDTR